MYCRSCGAKNHESSLFCTTCGLRLAPPSPSQAAQERAESLTSENTASSWLHEPGIPARTGAAPYTGFTAPEPAWPPTQAHDENSAWSPSPGASIVPYHDPFLQAVCSWGSQYTITCAACGLRRPSRIETCPGCGRVLVNNSGQKGVVPLEIAGGWNWGACLLPVWWGIAHENWTGLLGIVPGIGILLGARGNELAWQHRRFRSVEHFLEVQRAWRNASIGFAAVIAAFIVIILFGNL